jgi:hypothetical protein
MRIKMPAVQMPELKPKFEGETMNMLKWILGIVLLGAVVALMIVFWPTIMQTCQRYISRCGIRESDELEEVPKAA